MKWLPYQNSSTILEISRDLEARVDCNDNPYDYEAATYKYGGGSWHWSSANAELRGTVALHPWIDTN